MKPILALFLTLAMLLPLALYASAADTPAAILAMEKDGEALLDRLLTRQFDAFCAGKNVYTADILAETEETLLYREYLWWDCEMYIRGELPWDRYEYSLSFVRAEGNKLQYTVDFSYWFADNDKTFGQSGILYTIQLNTDCSDRRITAIDTDATSFDLFKYKFEKVAETAPDLSTRGITNLAIYDDMLMFVNGNSNVMTPKEAGKHLLDLLLQKEYTARCTGLPGEWDDLFTDTPGTAHYKQFLLDNTYCYQGGNIPSWYAYKYKISYANEEDPEDTSYLVRVENYPDKAGFTRSMGIDTVQYNLTIVKTEVGYRIADISTNDNDFFLYEMCFYKIFDLLENTSETLEELFPNLPIDDLTSKFSTYIYCLVTPFRITPPIDLELKELYSSMQNTVWWSIYGRFRHMIASLQGPVKLPTTANADNILDVTEQYLRALLIRACDARCGILPFSADGILKGQKTYDYAAYLADDIQKCQKRGGWAFYDINTRLVSIGNEGVSFDVTIEYWSKDSYLPLERNCFTIWLNTAYTEEEFYIREIRSDEPGYLAYLQKEAARPYREIPLPHVPWFCAPVPQKFLHGSVSA